MQGVSLVECGTHATVDAGFWPGHTSERVGGLRLLRSVVAGMLLLWDRGFHSFEMAVRTRAREAHFLGRVPSQVTLVPQTRVPDGSSWAWLRPSDRRQRQAGVRLRVRGIVYTLTDPTRPGYGQPHRLITSLLDPPAYPALDLVVAYHERWEVELTIDEIDPHQRLRQRPLRSQQPVGVIAVLYGLLIAHYAVRTVIQAAADRAGLDPDRRSFVCVGSLVRDAIYDCQVVGPAQHPARYARLLAALARSALPPRAKRTNPRVVKHKMSNCQLKRADQCGLLPLGLSVAATVQLLAPTAPLMAQDQADPADANHLLAISLISTVLRLAPQWC